MPDITTVKTRYFVGTDDAVPPSEPVPATFADSKITPLLDGLEFNEDLVQALTMVGTGDSEENTDHFIYIANWTLGLTEGTYVPARDFSSGHGPAVVNTSPYLLDGPGGSHKLIDVLKDKARAGVDVRVLGWISFAVMASEIAQASDVAWIAGLNAQTMKSIRELRSEPAIGAKAVLNVLSHTVGAVHTKMVVIGTATQAIGYTGGIDFMNSRWARPGHYGNETWHDVTAKVEGPAVQGMYDLFSDMWEENRTRNARLFRFEGTNMASCLRDTPELEPRELPKKRRGKHHVQNLRTLPVFRYKISNCLPQNSPLGFAPDGVFEIKAALKKAIADATTYIYIEDQFYWSGEVMGWVGQAVRDNPDLHVILLASGQEDPNDPEFPNMLLTDSINEGLIGDLDQSMQHRVRMFRRMGDVVSEGAISITAVQDDGDTCDLTVVINRERLDEFASYYRRRDRCLIVQGGRTYLITNIRWTTSGDLIFTVRSVSTLKPVVGDAHCARQLGVTVHSKTTLIDDRWALIGSANITRRSLYTDFEHALSFMDEDNLVVQNYRKVLWGEHFRHDRVDDFTDIQASLHAWDNSWGIRGAAPSRPSWIERTALPIAVEELSEEDRKRIRERYDRYTDPDSRIPWGGILP